MTTWDWILSVDKDVFSFIHSTAAVPALDWFMKMLREAFTWIPLYAFMLYYCFKYFGKMALPFLLCSAACFGITDYTSASILKPMLERPRPCYDDSLQPLLRNLVGCGGKYSFPSSHAANHFGLATFWFWSIYLVRGKRWYWLWAWAFAIGYAQIYVGKHYPLDIIGGAILGWLAGMLMLKIFEFWIHRGQRLVAAP